MKLHASVAVLIAAGVPLALAQTLIDLPDCAVSPERGEWCCKFPGADKNGGIATTCLGGSSEFGVPFQ